jgi:hypothetical protein
VAPSPEKRLLNLRKLGGWQRKIFWITVIAVENDLALIEEGLEYAAKTRSKYSRSIIESLNVTYITGTKCMTPESSTGGLMCLAIVVNVIES